MESTIYKLYQSQKKAEKSRKEAKIAKENREKAQLCHNSQLKAKGLMTRYEDLKQEARDIESVMNQMVQEVQSSSQDNYINIDCQYWFSISEQVVTLGQQYEDLEKRRQKGEAEVSVCLSLIHI